MTKRFLMAAVALSSLLATAAPVAATTQWTWSDISGQVTYRTNRPVWAMAYASGYWFYTDGIDLWAGGQVYRFDGTTNVNITVDLRNAGLSRVDDIVSDGQSVMFLQDMAVRASVVQAVTYSPSNGYRNITSVLRRSLLPGESFTFITGKNNLWMFVTSQPRLLRWFDSETLAPQIILPSELETRARSIYSAIPESRQYVSNTNGMSWPTSPVMVAVPLAGNRWLVTLTGINWQAYHLDIVGNSFSSLASSWSGTTNIQWVGSNGETAFVLKNLGFTGQNNRQTIRLWNGQGLNIAHNASASGVSFFASPTARAFSMGSEWMMLDGKRVFRVTTTSVETQPQVRDLFLTAAGNANGTLLVGGVESTDALSGPSFPLRAKLTRIGLSNVPIAPAPTPTPTTTVTPTSGTFNAYGIAARQWVLPNQTTLRRDESMTYTVGAQHAVGLKRVELVVNGILRKSCDLARTSAEQFCSFTLVGNEYPLGAQVAFNARVLGLDGAYQELWTPLMYVNVTDTIYGNTTQAAVSANSAPATWAWSIPGDTSILSSRSAYHVGAWDGADGITRIEIWENGNMRRICSYPAIRTNVECDWDVFASDFSNGSEVFVNARAFDSLGNTTWAASKSWRVQR